MTERLEDDRAREDFQWGPLPATRPPGRAPLRLRARFWRRGIEAVNADLTHRTTGIARVLAGFGAQVGGGGVLHGPLVIHNAQPDYRNLWLGRNVHLGRGVLLDLTEVLWIQDDATVSMGCTLLTHSDVGDRPLKRDLPARSCRTVIHPGAYIGANVTVLAGCDIGDRAIVAAGAVVTRPVPGGARVGGVPAREL